MKSKKLVLKKVVSASILLASKFYSTNVTKSNKQGARDYTWNVHLH